MRVVVLSAGKSTRLDGICKMLVSVKDKPAHRWHTDAWMAVPVDAVVLNKDVDALDSSEWEGSRIYGYDGGGGPASALLHYLSKTSHSDTLIVSFADSLIKGPVMEPGDWVGVANMPINRQWDYPAAGGWIRGKPRVQVCMGLYQFTDLDALRFAIDATTPTRFAAEVPMVDVLTQYQKIHPLKELFIGGWQDAGDWESIKTVR